MPATKKGNKVEEVAKYKSIPFLIFASFLTTFVVSRVFTYLRPEANLIIRGIHVHHLSYGIILLSILGYISLVKTLSYYNRVRLSIPFGIALGLAYDEFALWIQLEDVYHSRTNYDVVLMISLLMLNIIFFADFWKRWGSRIQKLLLIVFWTGPKEILDLLLRQ